MGLMQGRPRNRERKAIMDYFLDTGDGPMRVGDLLTHEKIEELTGLKRGELNSPYYAVILSARKAIQREHGVWLLSETKNCMPR